MEVDENYWQSSSLHWPQKQQVYTRLPERWLASTPCTVWYELIFPLWFLSNPDVFLIFQLPYFKDSICNHTLLETNIKAAWRSDAWKMILEKTCHVLRWRWNVTSIKGFPFDTFSKNSWNQIKPPKKQNRPSVWSMGFMFLFSKQKNLRFKSKAVF